MRTAKQNMVGLLIIAAMSLVTAGCSRSDDSMNTATNQSAADKVSGLFSGTGKYLPGNISLGNTAACTAPPADYLTKYQSAAATVDVTKLSDSTVTIAFLTGPFPQDKYSSVKLSENGNLISLGNIGFYDTGTKALSISAVAPGFSYSYLKSCPLGLPYYYSNTTVPNPGMLVHYTIQRYEFAGTKQ